MGTPQTENHPDHFENNDVTATNKKDITYMFNNIFGILRVA